MFPPNIELVTKAVLKQLVRSNRALAELKGYSDTIQNKHILINAKKLREMGVQRLRGGTWNSERVVEIIKNEKYAGNTHKSKEGKYPFTGKIICGKCGKNYR